MRISVATSLVAACTMATMMSIAVCPSNALATTIYQSTLDTDGSGQVNDEGGYTFDWTYQNGVLEIDMKGAAASGSFPMCFKKNNCTSVKTLVIKGNADSLGSKLGNKFPNLEKVSIQSTTLKHLDVPEYFGSLSSLSSVEFGSADSPLSLETLDNSYLFDGCEKLKTLDLRYTKIERLGGKGETTTSENSMPFQGSYLEEIKLPVTLKTVGQNAFGVGGRSTSGHDWSSLKAIVLPENVETIDKYGFMDLSSLETVYLPASVKSFDISQGKMGRTSTSLKSNTEIVVYGAGATELPTGLQAIVNAAKNDNGADRIKCVTLPAKVLAEINALKDATSADLAKVVQVQGEYSSLSEAAKEAPGYDEATWTAAEGVIATAVNKIWDEAFSASSGLTAEQKLSLVNSMIGYKNDELAQAKEAQAKAEAERDEWAKRYSQAQSNWIAANEVATSVTSMKANYERQLKEAQAKVDEAQAKVEELENLLDPDAVAANKAKIISLQDKLAISAIGGGSKVVKLNKKGKTKAKAVVKLKLVKSESGAAVACAKAKGTNKNVTVSDDGVLILKKGVKKGKYKAKVKLTCGNATKTVTYTFKAA